MAVSSPRRSILALLLVGAGGLLPVSLPAHEPLDRQIEAVSASLNENPDRALAHLRRAELYRLAGRWEEALADYAQAGRLDPELVAVDLGRAALEIDRGRPQTALDRLAARFDPEARPFRAWVLLSEAHEALGDPGKALHAMERAAECVSTPPPSLYLRRARLALELDPPRVDTALAALDEGVSRLGPVVALVWPAIELEEGRGNYEGALSRLDSVLPQFKRKESVLVRRGDLLVAAGRTLEAWVAYSEALAAVETLPPPRRNTPAVSTLETRARQALRMEPPRPVEEDHGPR